MIALGLVSAAIFGYGIYLICFENNQIDDDDQTDDSESDSYSESDATCDEEFSDAASETESEQEKEHQEEEASGEEETDDEMPHLIDEHEEIEDLWSSYHLEKKYDEMSQKKGLKDYLNLKEWKMGVRRRFREFLNSRGFRESPNQFIEQERSKRNRDEYAVIDDTALNLVEYYQLVASGDQSGYEMKNVLSK